ncbi:sugar phosphate isomerase/epimerase family protein [Zobellia galactanivorans]|uniref:sugar phosphate isomerase/epimerase family protein n=1 Tax=Zobellia galactanivorans (strain DSM 12802 / CCUG 47099 / CIP 106680 / NCIMB 13871 / Dsij) TaxID=63186 RepID=UPI001C078A2D|nr:TIM barrel protein [Zobellia galactanivorans]MBU3027603.1 sugar phosphate isomerase/epimerase [Zobellia galactanivorans]
MGKGHDYISRRHFSKRTAAALCSVPFMPLHEWNALSSNTSEEDIKVHLFSKHLQFLGYEEMSEVAADIGFDGLDLTVRPKGHVLPENVQDDLPKAVEAMRKYGLQPKMMTTNVLDAHAEIDQQVLKTASKLGLTHYRTGWLSYPEDRSIQESQEIYKSLFKSLEAANEKWGLIGCYQNHAGNHVGAPIWDLPPMLPGPQSKYLGSQYDIRHAVVEGCMSWELDLRLIAPYIRSIVIKDFKWGMQEGQWKPVNTPLGEGMVDFGRYFSLLKKYGINVPISLHLEYDLGGAEHGARQISIDKKVVYAMMKKDLTFLRKAWKAAE